MSMNLTIDDLKEIVRSLEKLDESGLEVTQIKVRNHHIHLRSVVAVPNTGHVVMTLPDNLQPLRGQTPTHKFSGDYNDLPVRPTRGSSPSHTNTGIPVQDVTVEDTPKRTWYVSGIAIASEQPSKPVYRQ